MSSTKEGGDHLVVWVDGSYSKAPPFESLVGGKSNESKLCPNWVNLQHQSFFIQHNKKSVVSSDTIVDVI